MQVPEKVQAGRRLRPPRADLGSSSCEFQADCQAAPVGHYSAEFWSGGPLELYVCRRHLGVLLAGAVCQLPYGEGPSRASWWVASAQA